MFPSWKCRTYHIPSKFADLKYWITAHAVIKRIHVSLWTIMKTENFRFSARILKFLMPTDKIEWHLFCQHTSKRTGTQSRACSFWIHHPPSDRALSPQAAESGPHSPLGDRQARLSGGERGNHGAKRSYPSAPSGQSRTPVPTKDTLHIAKNML